MSIIHLWNNSTCLKTLDMILVCIYESCILFIIKLCKWFTFFICQNEQLYITVSLLFKCFHRVSLIIGKTEHVLCSVIWMSRSITGNLNCWTISSISISKLMSTLFHYSSLKSIELENIFNNGEFIYYFQIILLYNEISEWIVLLISKSV